MGNCLVVGEKKMKKKEIEIKGTLDGKIHEYQSPMKLLQQVLSEFPGHSTTDALPVVRHLDPTADMRAGRLCSPMRPKKAPQAKAAVVRVKVVISKRELKKILEEEGLALGDMMSQVQMINKKIPGNCEEEDACTGWKPDLESIQELD